LNNKDRVGFFSSGVRQEEQSIETSFQTKLWNGVKPFGSGLNNKKASPILVKNLS
jgi:hypothetical protein